MPRLGIVWAREGRTTSRDVAIVVDVLRACTTIVTCLHHGADCVIPTTEVEDARRLAAERGALLMGERDSVRLPGFDLGNSPCAVTPELVAGRDIVFTSTSFPLGVAAASASGHVLIGCFLNIGAVTRRARALAGESGCGVCFVLSGAPDNPADEDRAFAGAAAALLDDRPMTAPVGEALRFTEQRGWERRVRESFHARRLARLGFAGDVDFACRRDAFADVPVLLGGRIVRA
jgi:2-phosphosulfolactate phosphatase